MRYKYTAVDASGKKSTGERETADKLTLYGELKSEGLTLVSAHESAHDRNPIDRFLDIFVSVPMQQKIMFAKNLGSMIQAGLPVSRGLTVLESQASSGKFRSIIIDLNLELKKGNTLSASIKKYPSVFSNLFVSMVKAGEESGSLSKALQNVGHQMDNTFKLNRKIKGAMIYPAVILSVMILIGALMFIFVVPSLTATFKQLKTELPTSTKFVIWTSDFLKDHWLLSLFGLVALVFAVIGWIKTKSGKKFFDALVLKLPVIKELVKETNSARMARTLSSLLSAGVPFAESILITGEVVQNHYFRLVIDEARIEVEKGGTVSSVFARHQELYPSFVSEMMSVGEETGNLPQMLGEVADFYENDVDQKTKDMSTIIEPILMVIIGAAVGFFAVSMITPIYSIMQQM